MNHHSVNAWCARVVVAQDLLTSAYGNFSGYTGLDGQLAFNSAGWLLTTLFSITISLVGGLTS